MPSSCKPITPPKAPQAKLEPWINKAIENATLAGSVTTAVGAAIYAVRSGESASHHFHPMYGIVENPKPKPPIPGLGRIMFKRTAIAASLAAYIVGIATAYYETSPVAKGTFRNNTPKA